MNVEVENLPNCITTLRVEVPADKVTQTWETVAKDYTQYAKIPGYRPGKAPRTVVENKFKKQIREEVEKKLLSESCREAISEKKIRVRSLADVQDIEVAKDQPMRFTATLVTEPDFDLPDYKNIPVKLKPADVADAEVDETIENLRERQADFIDLTGRPVALDDFAVIDYTGLIDGKPVEEVVPKAGKPLTGNTDFWIKVTQDGFIFKNFCENLVGANVGEARTFDVEVPADFAITELVGKKITYTVTVKSLKQKNLPELNDEFAAKMVEGKTLAGLREIITADLRQQKALETERDQKNQIVEHLLSKVECELPVNMVREEARRILSETVQQYQNRGVADNLLKENEKEIVETATKSARDRLRGKFILLRIAEKENLHVTKEEFNQRVEYMAERYRMPKEKLLKELSDRGALEQVNEEILTGKTLDFLASNVSVTPESQA